MVRFVTISSMFMGNTTLLIVYLVSIEIQLALLPLAGSLVTGCSMVKMLMTPPRRTTPHSDR